MSDSHAHSHDEAGGIWTSAAKLLALALTLVIITVSGALFNSSRDNTRAYEHPAPPKPAAPATAAAATPAPAPAAATGTAAAAPAPATATADTAPPSGVKVEGDTVVVTVKPGSPNPMSFDVVTFKVKAGQKVKISFYNVSAAPMQHNLVVGKLGSKEKLIAASNGMMADMANAMAKGYIPDSPEIIAHTKLLNAGEVGTIEFTAPADKGAYPYLCTFPGHAAIMNGTMDVE